jgi:hypothetical protein
MHDIGGAFDPADPEFGISLTPTSVMGAFDVLIHVDRTTPIRFGPAHRTLVDLDLHAASRPSNLDLSSGDIGCAPAGWEARSYGGRLPILPAAAEMVTVDGGGRALSLRPFQGDPEKVPVIAQSVDAVPYRGKVVTLSAWVRNDSRTTGIEARGWVRVQTSGGMKFFQAQRAKLKAGSGWVKVSVKREIPQDARELAFGICLVGNEPLLFREGMLDVARDN